MKTSVTPLLCSGPEAALSQEQSPHCGYRALGGQLPLTPSTWTHGPPCCSSYRQAGSSPPDTLRTCSINPSESLLKKHLLSEVLPDHPALLHGALSSLCHHRIDSFSCPLSSVSTGESGEYEGLQFPGVSHAKDTAWRMLGAEWLNEGLYCPINAPHSLLSGGLPVPPFPSSSL